MMRKYILCSVLSIALSLNSSAMSDSSENQNSILHSRWRTELKTAYNSEVSGIIPLDDIMGMFDRIAKEEVVYSLLEPAPEMVTKFIRESSAAIMMNKVARTKRRLCCSFGLFFIANIAACGVFALYKHLNDFCVHGSSSVS